MERDPVNRGENRGVSRGERGDPEPLHINAGPGLDPEARFQELMNEESPDGRPPTGPVRRESRVLFLCALVLITSVVIAALIWRSGSIIPGLMGLALMLGFIVLAAWPTWNAGAERKLEERHVADEVKAESRRAARRPT